MEGLEDRLAELRERITRAGGDWRAITVVAVTKGFGLEAVMAAHRAGLRNFGENYAAALQEKASAARLSGGGGTAAVRWHYLGTVQRNKVRALAPWVDLWQGVARKVEGQEIARRARSSGVLVQVNVTGSPHHNGCSWDEAPALVESLLRDGVDVQGLMCIGRRQGAWRDFRRLATLAHRLQLREISMGMSDDLEAAVQEGSTMVRVGTALFGPRPGTANLRR